MSTKPSPAKKLKHDSHPAVHLLRTALKQDSFTSGSCRVPAEFCNLYYNTTATGNAVYLNLAKASEQDLSQLIAFCDAAPFGQGTETVMDESYRKALKLELSQFSIPFELAATEILGKIGQELVQSGTILQRFVRAEPYKLNIYDKGCFFKSHQDTPRSDNMFGSLVVSFPTPHQGGSFVLKENEQEWTFDSGSMLASSTPENPQIAWVAFYSDVFHEVLPVTSGARITLTYNLYFQEVTTLLLASPSTNMKFNAVKGAIQQLIDDKNILSKGGYLCFGFAHQYSLKSGNRSDKNTLGHTFDELARYLKGGDAVIFSAAKELGLKPQLQVIYANKSKSYYRPGTRAKSYMGNAPLEDLDDFQVEDFEEMFDESFERIVGNKAGKKEMFWITLRASSSNAIPTYYIAYGNEAGLGYVYGNVCMIMELHRD